MDVLSLGIVMFGHRTALLLREYFVSCYLDQIKDRKTTLFEEKRTLRHQELLLLDSLYGLTNALTTSTAKLCYSS